MIDLYKRLICDIHLKNIFKNLLYKKTETKENLNKKHQIKKTPHNLYNIVGFSLSGWE